jgi:hypothetical protein
MNTQTLKQAEEILNHPTLSPLMNALKYEIAKQVSEESSLAQAFFKLTDELTSPYSEAMLKLALTERMAVSTAVQMLVAVMRREAKQIVKG